MNRDAAQHTTLTPDQMARACFMWDKQRQDTLQIAIALGLGREGEVIVWRALAERRDERRRMNDFLKRMAAS